MIWPLIDAVTRCLPEADRGTLFADIAAGDYLPVVEWLLRAALVTAHPLPATVIAAVDSWLDRYEGTGGQPAVRNLRARHAGASEPHQERTDTPATALSSGRGPPRY